MDFVDIRNTSQEDYYILIKQWVLSDFSFFTFWVIWRQIVDNFILGHTVESHKGTQLERDCAKQGNTQNPT